MKDEPHISEYGTLVQRDTKSYARLPAAYPRLKCSGRDDLGRSVLNDEWVSVTTGSEDYSFKVRTFCGEVTLASVDAFTPGTCLFKPSPCLLPCLHRTSCFALTGKHFSVFGRYRW